jgi:anhydro-N-acetylmuramic acid kinase
MSGTSMDAVDAVCVDLAGEFPRILSTHIHAISRELRDGVLSIAVGMPHDLNQLAVLDVRMGNLFADAALTVIEKAGRTPSSIQAIGSHGQTVIHQPRGDWPYTTQIGDPNIIAERTGVTTVADFRRRDMAAGGQGAPLVPAYHQAVFRDPGINRIVVNVGGMSNITVLPKDANSPVMGFDTGPGNVLLDAWAALHRVIPIDEGGRWAAMGKIHSGFLQALLADDFFSSPPPKSTGRDRFNLSWVQETLARIPSMLSPEDVQRTLCELTVASLSEAVIQYSASPREVLVCGGGVHNPLIMEGLSQALSGNAVHSTERYGLQPDWVEATAFAWLADRTLAGLPGNLPSVTGARRSVVLGAVYHA